jgi:hypothetical protein
VSYAECDTPEEGEDRSLYEQMATEYLWRWTGRRFGTCPVTIRPCRLKCATGEPGYGIVTCGRCRDTCGCNEGSTLRFSHYVAAIEAITIDGVPLSSDAYRLDDHRLLVRQDGGLWPYCQDFSLPAGEVGTWTVQAQFGEPVPIGGQVAAGKLALELWKAACGRAGCELPQRWQTISRQGVTISAALDTFEDIDKGHTGIWLIDSWVASVTRPTLGFALASPDVRPVGRR